MRNFFLINIVLFFICGSAYSQRINEPNDKSYIDSINSLIRNNVDYLDRVEEVQPHNESMVVDEAYLLKDQDLLLRALISSVANNDVDAINILLPLYESIDNKNVFLIKKARALQEMGRNSYDQAIKIYRDLLLINPDSLEDRFNLGLSLAYNYRNKEAIQELEVVAASNELSKEHRESVVSIIDEIKRRSEFDFGGGFAFLNDRNINQITSVGEVDIDGVKIIPPKRESGVGFSYNAFLSKKGYLADGYYSIYGLDSNGKIYFNNDDYNDVVVRGYYGFGYQDYVKDFSIRPYYEKRWFGNKSYLDKYGANFNSSYKFSSRWVGLANLDVGRKNHVSSRSYLDGNSVLINFTGLHIYNEKLYGFLGAGFDFEDARYKSDRYLQKNVRFGVGGDFSDALSFFTAVNLNFRNYSEGFAFFDKQKDRERNFLISLWSKKIHYMGFVPKINFRHERKYSNNPLFSYVNNTVFFSMEKLF